MNSGALSSNEHVQRFAHSAKEYCRLIENHSAVTPIQFVQQSAKLLLTLYLAAFDLPEVEFGESNYPKRVSDAQRGELYSDLKNKLGKWNLYWEFFNPYEQQEPVCSSMADDLTDIYTDLKHGIAFFDMDGEINIGNAVWEWKFGSLNHWGDHAVDVLRALHRVLAEHAFEEFLRD